MCIFVVITRCFPRGRVNMFIQNLLTFVRNAVLGGSDFESQSDSRSIVFGKMYIKAYFTQNVLTKEYFV